MEWLFLIISALKNYRLQALKSHTKGTLTLLKSLLTHSYRAEMVKIKYVWLSELSHLPQMLTNALCKLRLV